VAKQYVTVSSQQTVQILSQTTSADVEAVAIYTQPSNVYTVVLVPLKQWQDGSEAAYLAPVAELIEGLIAGGLISKMIYVQSSDTSNLLAGFMQAKVVYTATTGLAQPFTTKVLIPMTALVSLDAFNTYSTSDGGNDPILVAYNRLKATAGA
jgi:hypothetical protein